MHPYDATVVSVVEAELSAVFNDIGAKLDVIQKDPYYAAGKSLAEGALAVTLGLIGVASTGPLWIILGAMGAAAGFGGIGLGIAQLATAVDGPNPERDARAKLALDVSSNPFSLAGAAIGASTELGLERGAEIGSIANNVLSIGSGLKEVAKDRSTGWIDVFQGSIGIANIDVERLRGKRSDENRRSVERRGKSNRDEREQQARQKADEEKAGREEERRRLRQQLDAQTREEQRRNAENKRKENDEKREREMRHEMIMEDMERRTRERNAEYKKRQEEVEAAKKREREAAEAERKRSEDERRRAEEEAERQRKLFQSARAMEQDRKGYVAAGGGGSYGSFGSSNNDGDNKGGVGVGGLP